jgi:acylphosphatase
VNYHRITDEEAEELGLKGSPTILIDGVDPYPSEIDGFS